MLPLKQFAVIRKVRVTHPHYLDVRSPNMDDAKPMHILFIDDDQELLDGIRRRLKQIRPSWITHYEYLPRIGLETYAKCATDLDVVVCDLNMAMISGVQIMEAISKRSPHIGIIALSGQLDTRSLLGCDRYSDMHLCKPIDLEILCRKIEMVVQAKRKTWGRSN